MDFTDRIVDLAKEFPQIGIRISIEGLEKQIMRFVAWKMDSEGIWYVKEIT